MNTTELHPQYVGQVTKRLAAMEINLLGSGSFAELYKALNGEYRRLLCADAVSLLLRKRDGLDIDFAVSDSDSEGRTDLSIHSVEPEWIDHHTDSTCAGAWVGDYDPLKHAEYFSHTPQPLHTVVLLPLSRRAKTIGVLAFATGDWRDPFAMASIASLNRLAAIVAVCVENLYNHELLRQVSLHDPLTGLFNRRFFDDHIERALSLALRGGWPLSCVYFDIDFFKRINDTHGHAAGDVVLQTIATRLKPLLRSGEELARVGGEEFCIVLKQADQSIGAMVAERVRNAVATKPIYVPDCGEIDISISCGVADSAHLTLFERDCAARKLVENADEALYRAKQNGRNRVEVFTPTSNH
ncbi:MAG: GGDEF domain-containing protein [Pseudomonadota bacterium]